MRLDNSADERSDVELVQFSSAKNAHAETLVEIDVGGIDSSGDVKERDEAPITFVIDRVGQKDWALNFETGLFPHFSSKRLFYRFPVFDGSTETGPTPRVRNSFNVVTMMEEEVSIVGDDEEHRS